MALTLVSGPAAEPVTAAEMRTHLRLDTTDEDTYLGLLITAARERLVEITARPFVYETYEERLTEFPTGTNRIRLSRAPVVSVTSVTYQDSTAATNTFSADDYHVETAPEPGSVTLKYQKTWPTTTLETGHPVTVTYRAGYASAAASVPERRRLMLKALVAHWYAHREPVLTGTIQTKLPDHMQALILADRLWL
jgi:uncharacterized phiE125 gp8 family phage protein